MHTRGMTQRPNHGSSLPSGHQSGFTLIELMVVVALVAIVGMFAVPSWTEMRIRGSLRTAVNNFTASLQFARSEAARLKSPVTVCPSADGANCTDTSYELGWIVRTGPQTNAANQIIRQDTLPNNLFRLDATTANTRRFTFLPNGLPAGNFNGATLEACPADPHYAALTRAITINRAGEITLSTPGSCSI